LQWTKRNDFDWTNVNALQMADWRLSKTPQGADVIEFSMQRLF
jgi:hypothetical protein